MNRTSKIIKNKKYNNKKKLNNNTSHQCKVN